jgi:hypothetical protein
MRRILAWSAAVGLLGGLGCTHEVCDCCQDPCGGCCTGKGAQITYIPNGHPAPATAPMPESIKAPPKSVPEAPKSKEKSDASGDKSESPVTLDQ